MAIPASGGRVEVALHHVYEVSAHVVLLAGAPVTARSSIIEDLARVDPRHIERAPVAVFTEQE